MDSWNELINEEKKKPYFQELRSFVITEREKYNVFPRKEDLLNAFTLTPFKSVKVVILGQDPYHEKFQAMGLAFSVRDGIKAPSSLINIRTEIVNEGLLTTPWSNDLTRWAEQGVFLLNTALTVREGEPGSHFGHGWEIFTDRCIKELSYDDEFKVFVLWGNKAKEKLPLLDSNKHLVLTSAHPSGLSASRGFFGNGHFKKINNALSFHGKKEIIW